MVNKVKTALLCAIAVAVSNLAAPAALADVTEAQPPSGVGDPALDAEAFDRFTLGITWDTHDDLTGLYGVESFLSGRRVIWMDSEGCMRGTWRQAGEQICFDYEDRDVPVCWTYHERGDSLTAWFQGDRQTVPIHLYPTKKPPLSCGDWLGA